MTASREIEIEKELARLAETAPPIHCAVYVAIAIPPSGPRDSHLQAALAAVLALFDHGADMKILAHRLIQDVEVQKTLSTTMEMLEEIGQ
jgi:hypothetical protein